MLRAKFLKTGRVAHPTDPRRRQAYGRKGDEVEVGEGEGQLDPETAEFAAEHGWLELSGEADGPDLQEDEPKDEPRPGRRKRSKRETKDDPPAPGGEDDPAS